jgi:DNA-binding NarL/FixJ family response regulator
LRLVNSIRVQKIQDSQISLLSQREQKIALLAADGLSNKSIAEKVFLSESRIKTTLSEIYKKLEITDNKDKRQQLAKMFSQTRSD